MQRGQRFDNWSRNQTCLPMRWSSPSSTTEVAEIVGFAHQHEQRVKAVGAGHSFTDTACTDGVLIVMENLDQLSDVDLERSQVTVGAGIRLDALNEGLHELGLALPNLGDIAVQTLAGATATGTHGTGVGLGNLSTTIVGFEIVTGTGEVLWCDAEHHRELFESGRVGIGALGIITRIRLQCVPSFVLRADERVVPLDEVLADWDGFIHGADHAELFFISGHSECFSKQNRRTDEAEQPRSKLANFVEKELVENVALDLANRVVRRWPSQRPRVVTAFGNAMSDRQVVDRSYRIFASPRRVRFVEMEYSIPVAAVPEAVQRVQAFVETLPEPPLFPVEVRVSAADDIALSTAQGRTSGWIAVHQYQGIAYGDYFRGVEAIMNHYDGRPHWGKFHYQTHDVLRERYERWDEFAEVRAKVDPSGVFRNAYLDRVLGPIR